jgi:transcriptional regulator with XRE-family HTH domain
MANTFGQKLKEWREAAGITQAELARRIDASPTWVSNLERDFSPTAKGGKPQPSVETCDKIAHALGVRIAEVRIAAGYTPPGKPESWLIKEPEKDDKAKEQQAQAARMADLIKNFGSLSPEKQSPVLAIVRVLQADYPELLKMLRLPIEIVETDSLSASDARDIENTPP